MSQPDNPDCPQYWILGTAGRLVSRQGQSSAGAADIFGEALPADGTLTSGQGQTSALAGDGMNVGAADSAQAQTSDIAADELRPLTWDDSTILWDASVPTWDQLGVVMTGA